MSDDYDQKSWFSDAQSSDSADGDGAQRRLEAVPVSESSVDPDWFGDEPSDAIDGGEGTTTGGDRRSKALFVGVVGAVLAVVAGSALLMASVVGGAESSSEAAPLTAPPVSGGTQGESDSSSSIATAAQCESSESPTATTGDGEGDTKSVAGVVLAFQHAYYVERDAEQMEPLLAKDSKITDLDALQEGIDSVARGTTHCLRIAPDKDGTASVTLTETAPDETETIYTQRVSTTREGGDLRIVSIEDQE